MNVQLNSRGIEGLLPVVPTPLRDGQIDDQGCHSVVEALAAHVHGLTLLGSLGEGPSLSVEERERACEAFVEAVDRRVAVVLSVGSTALSDAVRLARFGERSGVDALFLPPPGYYAATEKGLLSFFRAVSESTELPVILYDNPYITGVRLTTSFMARLAELAPAFRYVKVTDRAHGKVEAILAETPLVPLSGSDDVMHHQVLRGARGAMTGVPCVAPRASRRWWDLLEGGENDAAFGVFAAELAPIAIEMASEGDEYPVVAKECLRLLGVIESAEARPPLEPLDDRRLDDLRRALAAAGEAAPHA